MSTTEATTETTSHPPPSYPPPDSETTTDRIIAAADTNSELLSALASTSDAPSNLAASNLNVDKHRHGFTDQDKIVAEHKGRTSRAFKNQRKYHDSLPSTIKRGMFAACCMLSKFEAKASEVEQEYVKALDEQKKAEDRRQGLQENLDKAKRAHEESQSLAELHMSSHMRLDELYQDVFREPTPKEYPEQEEMKKVYDSMLAALYGKKEQYHFQQAQRGADLMIAKRELKDAAKSAEEARQALELERERIFERVAGFGQAPPAYTDCCNRAECQDLDLDSE